MRKARYAVANTSDVPPDTAKTVALGPDGGECVLVRHQDQWFALGSLCPHQNAPLEGAPAEAGRLICRRHGYCFDLKTGDCVTAGGYGLPVYSVEIEDTTVFVSLWEFD